MSKLRVAVLISGRGSNMQALIDACADPAFPAEIVCVISDRPSAAGLDRARQAAIPAHVVRYRDFETRADFETALHDVLQKSGADFICLAGFMRLLGAGFVDLWRDRMINIHPSLLPAYRGLNTHERVLDDGTRFTGCTVHFVRAEMDDGPILMQAVVPVLPGDTPEALAARVLEQEHRIYPAALRLVAMGQTQIVEGHVLYKDAGFPEAALISPSLPERA